MIKADPNAHVTNKTLGEAVDTILKGMDDMFTEQKKVFATKEDLKREISWVRDDINGLKADLTDTVSKKEFQKLKSQVDRYIAS